MSAQVPFSYVADACKEAKISAILIGGQALASRGYQRLTLDVDFMVTEEDYEKLKPAISSRGYSEVVRTNVAAKWQGQSPDLIDIDFMFVDRATFEAIKKESKEEDYYDGKFLVPKVEHLIALKLHAMKQQPQRREPKDLNDVIQLIRTNRIDVKAKAFESLCKQFGTDDLYRKIVYHTQIDG